MNIAIFGGSFDPPHNGHEAIVYEALKILDIDKLYVIPTYLSPFKNSFFLDENTRLNLLKKLFKGENRVFVDDFEAKQKRAVFTIETVEFLQKKTGAKKIYLVIGEDNLEKLHLWHNFEKLKDMVTFCVAQRGGRGELPKEFLRLKIDVDVSSTQLKNSLDISQIPNKIKKECEEILKKGV